MSSDDKPQVPEDEYFAKPQGPVTGRYEIASNAFKPPGERKWKRWNEVPLWYRVLDRFGLPTLLCVFLMAALVRIWSEMRADWKDQHLELVREISRLADGISEAAKAEAEVRQIILDRVGRKQ